MSTSNPYTPGIIGIESHRISCIIGNNPHEWEQEQDIFVDVKVETDFSACAASDKLTDTIDYVQLAELCTELATKQRYHLMETFAVDVLEKLLHGYPSIRWAWIRIKKPGALPSSAYTYVELEKRT